MDKKQLALDAMEKKFNCAQSVFSALAEQVGIDRETALKTAACFGGGMRCGEVCGAVTGALMALGQRYGSSKENDLAAKQLAGEKTLEFIRLFKERNETILCRELLGFNPQDSDQMTATLQKGHAEVCQKAVADAVEIADGLLAEPAEDK